MEESTTGNVVDTSVADNSSITETTNAPAESQPAMEENVSNDVQPVSDETAHNKPAGDDAALAKFAKGQGISDLSELSERELSLLKMARDNKSAFDKSKQSQAKLDESSKSLAVLGDDATEVQRLSAKVQAMEFAANKKNFFSDKDTALEPVMAEIVAEKRQKFGDDYARVLLSDLDGLYAMAQLKGGATDTSAAVEAAKREERSSMNQSLAASSADVHATSSKPAAPTKVTAEWIRNEYDPTNADHRKIVDAATKKILK